jgi:YjbE family integral membrane protein
MEITTLISSIFHILILNIVLSGDNVGVIALATLKLEKSLAKKATYIGITAAMLLRIIFCVMIAWVLAIQWLPIKLVGGIILVKITWDLIKPQHGKGEEHISQKNNFWGAVGTIIIADLTMSLDNILAIASAANNRMGLMIFGVLLSLPIILFGSQFVAYIMKKYAIVIYIGGAILARTAFNMLLEDSYVEKYVRLPHMATVLIPWFIAVVVIVFGLIEIYKPGKQKAEEIPEQTSVAEEVPVQTSVTEEVPVQEVSIEDIPEDPAGFEEIPEKTDRQR